VEQRSKAVIAATTGLSLAGLVFVLQPRVDSPRADGVAPRQEVDTDRSGADHVLPVSSPGATPTIAATRPLTVTFDAGLLAIRADAAPLDEILAAVTRSVGVTFVGADAAREAVSIDAGPAPVRQVLSALLSGANYGYAFVNDPGRTAGAGPGRVLLLKRLEAPQPPAAGRLGLRSQLPTPPSQAMPVSADAPGVRQQQVLDELLSACKEQGCDTS